MSQNSLARDVKMNIDDLKEQMALLPHSSGVYIFYDISDNPIYVGKAVDLKKRVVSYLKSNEYKEKNIREKAKNIRVIVTSNEFEALILESNLIKKFSPRYNVLLRDDKSYPYLAIIYDNEFPRIAVTRRTDLKKAKYYGPYMAWSLRQMMELLRSIFRIATCKTPDKGRGSKGACLYMHINRCLGPCAGEVDKNDYLETLKGLQLFLEGKHGKIIKLLKTSMTQASTKREYEKAARYRDMLLAVQGISDTQKVVSKSLLSSDIIGFAEKENVGLVQVLSVRDKKLTGSQRFILKNTDVKAEAIRLFLMQHYMNLAYIPKEICLPFEIEDRELVEKTLSDQFGRAVKLLVPVRGERVSLIKMAEENAVNNLDIELSRQAKAIRKNTEALDDLKQQLKLEYIPRRIECYDISNLSGTNAVGSMIVFEDGEAAKSEYRRFKVHYENIDDARMMREVISRRFSRLSKTGNSIENLSKADKSFEKIPQLIVVDGGLSQTSEARRSLDELKLAEIKVVGLAKKNEEVYLPFNNHPIKLKNNSQGKFLMQRIRDEAHRFAVSYHSLLRSNEMLASVLEKIQGIGEKRRQILLKNFDSLEQIGQSDEEHLIALGLPRDLAQRLIKKFNNYGARVGR